MNASMLPVDAAEQTAQSDDLRYYLLEIGKVPLLTADQEIELGYRIQAGDQGALRQMVEANLRLVVSVAKRYMWSRLSLLDLVQEGNIGLLHAATKYDPSKGYRFSTYAIWWVRQHIARAVDQYGQTIRVPVYLHDDLSKQRRKAGSVDTKPNGEPTSRDMDRRRALDYRLVMAEKAQHMASLDLEFDDGNGTVLSDFLEDKNAPSPVTETERMDLRARLLALLATLPEKERRVLVLRFGLEDCQPRLLGEVGTLLGLTRERIRQIELAALGRLRRSGQIDELGAFLA
jgi:RNA polymerase primary sigma factor